MDVGQVCGLITWRLVNRFGQCMLSKILFTIAVIVGVLAFARFRQRRSAELASNPPRVIHPAVRRMPIGWLASAAVVLMLLASGVLLYNHWRDANAVIYVRVVDAGSGQSTAYRAYRGDIEDREFVTVDGVRVILAETERLETSTRPPPQN